MIIIRSHPKLLALRPPRIHCLFPNIHPPSTDDRESGGSTVVQEYAAQVIQTFCLTDLPDEWLLQNDKMPGIKSSLKSNHIIIITMIVGRSGGETRVEGWNGKVTWWRKKPGLEWNSPSRSFISSPSIHSFRSWFSNWLVLNRMRRSPEVDDDQEKRWRWRIEIFSNCFCVLNWWISPYSPGWMDWRQAGRQSGASVFPFSVVRQSVAAPSIMMIVVIVLSSYFYRRHT